MRLWWQRSSLSAESVSGQSSKGSRSGQREIAWPALWNPPPLALRQPQNGWWPASSGVILGRDVANWGQREARGHGRVLDSNGAEDPRHLRLPCLRLHRTSCLSQRRARDLPALPERCCYLPDTALSRLRHLRWYRGDTGRGEGSPLYLPVLWLRLAGKIRCRRRYVTLGHMASNLRSTPEECDYSVGAPAAGAGSRGSPGKFPNQTTSINHRCHSVFGKKDLPPVAFSNLRF